MDKGDYAPRNLTDSSVQTEYNPELVIKGHNGPSDVELTKVHDFLVTLVQLSKEEPHFLPNDLLGKLYESELILRKRFTDDRLSSSSPIAYSTPDGKNWKKKSADRSSPDDVAGGLLCIPKKRRSLSKLKSANSHNRPLAVSPVTPGIKICQKEKPAQELTPRKSNLLAKIKNAQRSVSLRMFRKTQPINDPTPVLRRRTSDDTDSIIFFRDSEISLNYIPSQCLPVNGRYVHRSISLDTYSVDSQIATETATATKVEVDVKSGLPSAESCGEPLRSDDSSSFKTALTGGKMGSPPWEFSASASEDICSPHKSNDNLPGIPETTYDEESSLVSSKNACGEPNADVLTQDDSTCDTLHSDLGYPDMYDDNMNEQPIPLKKSFGKMDLLEGRSDLLKIERHHSDISQRSIPLTRKRNHLDLNVLYKRSLVDMDLGAQK